MFHKDGNRRRTWRGRAFSLFLAAVLLLGSVPGLVLPASAHWADSYLDQLVDWGVMRADQTAKPDTPLTRAEFMAIINRAYGYHEIGEMPFEDVSEGDWFYDDVAIAYNAGYMKGTSKTTASPNARLTREQAVCILGRNMMMKETPGEDLAFTDSRSISTWARGMVKTAVNQYIIGGFPDDTFRPKDNITKGQMAVLVAQCVGTPVNASGAYELGDVSGNLTITAPNVTLRNTTVSGDLYVSGGVGLGGIKLENVNVLGRIVVSGTGESEAGGASVIMRNVTANEMLVDNMRDKTVTIRADGITEIPKTVVRTSAYIEDNNTDDKGLMSIELDGDSGSRLTLAGRIKEVIDKTPNSLVQVAKGTVAKLTVDEAAVNANVQLDRNTSVKEMNLDVGTNVTGDGDIGQLNVNAPGCVVSMLPDKIYIRPGITGNIGGIIMDHTDAEEGSLDPRLLSGYPAAKDITPTGLRADFAGNKKGTVYWAVSSITDGSIGEDDLISPPSYGSKAVRNGSAALPTGGSEVSAQVTGLTVGGSYYLSAVLVDDLGNRSPVKVVSFSTPDNTVPAFGQGYPYMSFVGKANEYDNGVTAQAAVMATKTCRMYYAVLPAGAAAPTTDELRSASVRSNLGYGVVELEKNYVWDGDRAIIVSRRLDQQKDYVLYLWLTDGVNSSEVTSLAFTTPDVTPPEFVAYPKVNGDAQAATVPMTATINEDGTIYWVAVKSGAYYPLPNPSNDKENTEDGKTARLDSEYAKIQVANGMNAVSKGSVTAKANTPVNLNITGLQAETSYDVYFLIRDTAGNDARSVYKLPEGIRTLDTGDPTVRQTFSKVSGGDNTRNPMSDSGVTLEFSENVRLGGISQDLLSMYRATQEGSTTEREAARKKLSTALRESIKFYDWTSGDKVEARVKGDAGVREDNWQIDYDAVTVTNVEGKIELTFPGTTGVSLASGGTYSFAISGVKDLGDRKMKPENGTVDFTNDEANGHKVPRFTVVFAQVKMIDQFVLSDDQLPKSIDNLNKPDDEIGDYKADFKFRLKPESTSTVAEGICYDLLLWTNTNIEFDLYYRVVNGEGEILTLRQDEGNNYRYLTPAMEKYIYTAAQNGNGWITLDPSGTFYSDGQDPAGKSLHKHFTQAGSLTFPEVRSLDENAYYEFVVSIRKKGTANSAENPDTWSGEVNLYVDVAASTSTKLSNLSDTKGLVSSGQWQKFLTETMTGDGGESIGLAVSSPAPNDPRRLYLRKTLYDSRQPVLTGTYPYFIPADTGRGVRMNLTLDREGTIYYAIAPAHNSANEPEKLDSGWEPLITTLDSATGQAIQPNKVPQNGTERNAIGMPTLITPDKIDIYRSEEWNEAGRAITGKVDYLGKIEAERDVTGLEPNRMYYVYLTIKGTGPEPSTLEIYRFKTKPEQRPKITLADAGEAVDITISNMDAKLNYLLYLEEDLEKITYGGEKWTELTLKDVPADGVDIPSQYKNYTLLQALRQGYTSSNPLDSNVGYSLFDLYASTDMKKILRDWIKDNSLPPQLETTGGGSEQHDGFAMRKGVTQQGGDKASFGSKYYILTMARGNSKTDDDPVDTTFSFRALPFNPSSRKAPDLDSATADVIVDGTTREILEGEIRLVFDTELHISGKADPLEGECEEEFFGKDLEYVDSVWAMNTSIGTAITIKLTEPTGKETLSLSVIRGHLDNGAGAITTKDLLITISYPEKAGADRQVINVKWGNDNKLVDGPDKPVSVKPVTTSVPGASGASTRFTVNDANTVEGTSQISFDAPLYAGEDTPVTSVQQLKEIADEIKGIDLDRSQVITSEDGTTLVLKLKGKAEDVSLKIDGGKLTNSAGEAAKEALSLHVEKRLPTGGNDANMKLNSFYTDVSWGDQTWTDKGSNK